MKHTRSRHSLLQHIESFHFIVFENHSDAFHFELSLCLKRAIKKAASHCLAFYVYIKKNSVVLRCN